MQLTKQGFAFVFDRVTGKPVWPIEERPVPRERRSRRAARGRRSRSRRSRAPFAAQGVSLDDAFDLTPELKAAAQRRAEEVSRSGRSTRRRRWRGRSCGPGVIGGANWGGGAFDPETGMLYVKTSHPPAVVRIVAAECPTTGPRAGEVDAEFVGEHRRRHNVHAHRARCGALPLLKPPYGELVAVELGTGDIAWRVPFGDTPAIRNHPALAGVTLPARLGVAGAPGAIVTKGGLVFVGGSDTGLNAFDKQTGALVFRLDLGRATTGTPMTYRTPSGHQFIVIATGSGREGGAGGGSDDTRSRLDINDSGCRFDLWQGS